MNALPATPSDKFPDIIEQLPDRSPGVRTSARVIAEVVERTNWCSGKSPTAVAASSMYLADLIYNPEERISQTDYDVISAVTIRAQHRELPGLFLDHVTKEDLEQVGDESDQLFLVDVLEHFREIQEVQSLADSEDRPDIEELESKSLADYESSLDKIDQPDLDKLRERAEESAQENPTQKQVTTTQYDRSTPVKEYAKARADGTCECCEEPAPFEDKDGGPYLEVHHVEELSDGGADGPDQVAAICPTCHSHIHHGKNGSELNARLKDKLEAE